MVVAVGLEVVGWIGGKVAPPRVTINKGGLIEPVGYPFWRRISDWVAGRRYVLLTFDDGPFGDGVDEKILTILRKHHAVAIFFEVCERINNNKDVLQKIQASGSFIGNHSYHHLHLSKLSGDV